MYFGIPFIHVIQEQTMAIIESVGKFDSVAPPGLVVLPPWKRIAGRLSLRVQEMQVHVETKTKDDVFVRLTIAVQYFVLPAKVRDAFYRLSNPVGQIESFVFDEVRSAVPNMTLDDVFQNKDYIADSVKKGLEETMLEFGYGIIRALVNDIDPDARVKAAMNEINAATRLRKAAEERGEAERILKVKQAQGEAESNILRGKGIAGQRKAIIDGLRESVEEFQKGVPGASGSDVMMVLMMTQYFDTLKEVGANSRSNSVFLPHSPQNVMDMAQLLSGSLMTGNTVSDAIHPTPASKSSTGEPDPSAGQIPSARRAPSVNPIIQPPS
jgi:regulator of protease activity HflC (stomatin/prohibitin superfamily)